MQESQLVQQAINGDKKALNDLIKTHQDMVYNLAIRMLWHPEDAKDATQEILVKFVTRLQSFKGESALKTWVYSLASNHLMTYNKKYYRQKLNFNEYRSDLYDSFSDSIAYGNNEGEKKLLIQEAKVGCSNAMLQCLNEQERITYILGEILELDGVECSEILDVPSNTFRKRLSRVRTKFNQYLHGTCGIVNEKNACRCYKKVDVAIEKKRIDPSHLMFTSSSASEKLIQSINDLQNASQLYQTNPEYESPELMQEIINAL